MFPTLWPLVQSLGGDRTVHGYTVGSFSFGRALASPCIGRWSGKHGYKATLGICSLVICLGGFVYATARNLPMLIAGQILIGIGSGSLGVTRAYVAELSSPASRTVLLAYLTAVQYCGFTCTPFIGAILTYIFGGGYTIANLVEVDKFNAPGYFTSLWAISNAILLFVAFREPAHSLARIEAHKLGLPLPESPKKQPKAAAKPASPLEGFDIDSEGEEGCFESEEPVLASLLFLNVATKGSIACFETLGAMFAFAVFSMSIPSAGQLFAGCGAAGVVSLLFFRPLCNVFDEVQLILGGILVMVVSCLTVASLHSTTPIYFFYGAVALMYAIGYPIGHTAVIGVFSKVAEGKSQGTLLSWFGTAGSLARILFPMFSGYVAQTLGFSALFTFIGAFLIATLAAVMYGRKCLRRHMRKKGG
uniref:Major facilitator superfamily (MFS) profile domain-containing protein n=2 Tax=Phaeomonas parva TaxID=124430 RepID=A0A7S1UDF5_9STRA|mmetsp:Transcript_43087/g.135088  ORF Transcript_43087/g.135088 Transcript_43087/m.135088 type:complete len:418 (+) Transcript_43087:365-1618(+)